MPGCAGIIKLAGVETVKQIGPLIKSKGKAEQHETDIAAGSKDSWSGRFDAEAGWC